MEEFERVLISWQLGLEVEEKGKIFDAIKDAANNLTGAALEEFNSLHPRDNIGRFTAGVGNAVKNVVGLGKKEHTISVGTASSKTAVRVESTWASSGPIGKQAVEMSSYIRSPRRVKKDLDDTFGHLDVEGPTMIRLHDTPISMDATREAILNRSFGYDPVSDSIIMNYRAVEGARNFWTWGNIIETPKNLLLHEYTHALVMKNDKVFRKYLPDFEKDLEKLVGKEVKIKHVNVSGIKELSGTIKDVKVESVRFLEHYDQRLLLMEKMGIKADKLTSEQRERLKDVYVHQSIITFDDGYVAPLNDITTNEMNQHIEIRGIDARTIYSLGRLDEYLAVKVERGWKP